MKKHIIALAALGLPLAAMAQTVKVDFEDASGYKSVGVYDTWEESPFRLGTLKGNCAVVDNFISPTNELGEVVNDSKKFWAYSVHASAATPLVRASTLTRLSTLPPPTSMCT